MFTSLFSRLQGSSLKDETCGRSQRFPPESETCRAVQPRALREGQDMRHISLLLSGLLFILSMARIDGFARAG